MICINPKKNVKLLETFNNDPYYDIVVHTATNELHLVMGYLSIDSLYFDQVSPDAKEINLEHLPEGLLVKILRSLYGEELWSSNVHELNELYSIIEFLEINEYKDNLIKYIIEHPQLMDSFELIEFCFTKKILEEEIRDHHFALKLSVLASTKNYLQLNKLSQKTLNSLLLKYHELKGSSADHTINSIIENYLGRTEIRPNDYFIQPELEPLLLIWEKYHHSISYLIAAQDQVKHSQFIDSQSFKTSMNQTMNFSPFSYPISSLTTCPSMASSMSPFVGSTLKHNYQTTAIFTSELEEKEKKINELESELALKKEIIERLQEEVINLRKELVNQHIIHSDSDEEIQYGRYERKGEGENSLNVTTSGNNEISLMVPAFNNDRKNVNDQAKNYKTMNKLNERSRKIFS